MMAPLVVLYADRSKAGSMLQFFFDYMSIIATLPLYPVMPCSFSLLLSVASEGCGS